MTSGDLVGVVLVLGLCSLWHAARSRGIRPALAFLAIAVATSWGFEQVGVVTGLVFGPYHYSAALGPSIGSVPIVIPLAWFALAHPTLVLTELIGDRWSVRSPSGRRRLAGLALLGAILMVAWDLALDPILSGPVYRAWTWGPGTAGTAVPLQNSVGWLATAFAIYLLYGAAARRGLVKVPQPARTSDLRGLHRV